MGLDLLWVWCCHGWTRINYSKQQSTKKKLQLRPHGCHQDKPNLCRHVMILQLLYISYFFCFTIPPPPPFLYPFLKFGNSTWIRKEYLHHSQLHSALSPFSISCLTVKFAQLELHVLTKHKKTRSSSACHVGPLALENLIIFDQF